MGRRFRSVLLVVLGLGLLLGLSVAMQLRLPTPDRPVGRTQVRFTDEARDETVTADPADKREVVAWVWYPAVAGTGRRASYLLDYRTLAAGLRASGELSPVVVAALRFVRSPVRVDAVPDVSAGPYPVVVVLPGNGTNAEFYHALSAGLAAHGYVVVGVNHPYDSAAVALGDGRVAVFDAWTVTPAPETLEARTAARDEVRIGDAVTLLERLPDLTAGTLGGALDLSRVAVVGHSLGGVAAAGVARARPRVRSWVNLDGIQRGGPFSTDPALGPGEQPFLFVTKEAELHPRIEDQMRAISGGSWRVVLAGASHDSFTDGPLLTPSVLPLPGGADRIATLVERYVRDFLDLTLRGGTGGLLAGPDTPGAVVYRY